jgi:ubiquinone/menaquinone biosynthesis C-methylase UbiE
MQQRAKIIPAARGRVLEVGIGSGLNLGFYDPERVESVHGIDPAPEMLRMAEKAARRGNGRGGARAG